MNECQQINNFYFFKIPLLMIILRDLQMDRRSLKKCGTIHYIKLRSILRVGEGKQVAAAGEGGDGGGARQCSVLSAGRRLCHVGGRHPGGQCHLWYRRRHGQFISIHTLILNNYISRGIPSWSLLYLTQVVDN